MPNQTISRALTIALLVLFVPLWALEAQSGASGRGRTRSRTATVIVETNVSDARVSVNGDLQGGSPPWEFTLNPGDYRITVAAPGYETFRDTINVSAGQTVTVDADLASDRGRLRVETNVSDAEIELNGDRRGGDPPWNFQLEPGRYRVEVSASGYETYRETVNLRAGQSVTLDADLDEQSYSINIDPEIEGARITIEGELQAQGSLRTSLRPGRYEIRIEAPGFDTYTRTITIRGNVTLRPQLNPSTVTVRVEIPDDMRADDDDWDEDDDDFVVYIDGTAYTGRTLQVRPGRHTFRIVSGGWAAEGRFVLRPGQTYTLRPSLTLTMEQ